MATDKELAERHLSDFIEQAWHVVEPGKTYIHGWHIDAITEHLEAVTHGEIRNLIINIPPRHMKSLNVAVFWPAWTWTFDPSVQWLFSSYAEKLAVRDSVKCRRLLQSNWYQERWGDVWEFAGDQNQKMRYENDHAGYRIATSVGGTGTGEGGDIIVVDDPIKRGDAYSDVIREGVNDWWDETMSTRLNDPKTSAKVIIMQRLHEDDLTGHLEEKMKDGGERYEMLVLPAEYEPNRCMTVMGAPDPRSEPDELLWPERFGREEIEQLKKTLGEFGTAGQLQQRPSPAGGGIFKEEWWAEGRNRYDATDRGWINRTVQRWMFFDTALKDKQENDPSACAVIDLMPDYSIVLRHVWRDKIQSAQLPAKIETLATRYNEDLKLQGVVIEDKGSGTTAIQTLRSSSPAWLAEMIFAFQPLGSKPYRARLASIWCERDCVWFPHPSDAVPWWSDFEDELFKFPNSRNDDQVDVLVMAVLYLEHYLAEGWYGR